MKEKSIMSISPKRLKEIENIPDSKIDTSDIPELDDNFWTTAKMVQPIRFYLVFYATVSKITKF